MKNISNIKNDNNNNNVNKNRILLTINIENAQYNRRSVIYNALFLLEVNFNVFYT